MARPGTLRASAPHRMPDDSSDNKRSDGLLWLRWAIPLLLVALLLASEVVADRKPVGPSIDYSSFYSLTEQGHLARVTISGHSVAGMLKEPQQVDGKPVHEFSTTLPAQEDQDLLPLLRRQHVDVKAEPEQSSLWGPLMVTLLPWVLVLGAWTWLARRARGAISGVGSPLQSILKGRPHRFERQDHVRVRFDDVAGLTNAKRDLQEVVDFLRTPERFQRLGGKLPRGALLVGPPGTGKTLLARAVAGEAEVPFFYVNGSEFIQLFVGVGAARVRELFDEAKAAAPAIVFIDEIDAVGRSRGAGLGGGNDEREQTLNQLLSEMDGFTPNDHTVVVAATNRPDVLDPALLRPGRFDRRVIIDRPECESRLAILRVHTRHKPLAPDVSLADLARATPGFSGADLANLCNEAALAAVRRGVDALAQRDFSSSMDKILLGDPREALLDPQERRRVATHEAGHAIVAHFSEHAEPLRRVSILPRGMSLGATQQWASNDRHIVTEPELEAKLRVLMGGYAAESTIYGNLSSGSEQDLRQATDFAFRMVAHYGMSQRVGPMFHEQRVEHPFLGQRLATETGLSDETAHEIEQEARRMLSAAVEAAKHMVENKREALDRLIGALLEHETLEKGDLDRVLGAAQAAA
ncbi:MAG TPA: ATP-dependent zinc metalloprotease FtsH [Polyangiaceae bacterium]|nr:ATP-dependent zinc metalloprotease FtsH [Polyangiaceae bacterium]